MPGEGVGRARGSVGTLTSLFYARAPPWLSGRYQLNPPVIHRWGGIGPVMGEPPDSLPESPTTAAEPPHQPPLHLLNLIADYCTTTRLDDDIDVPM